MKKFYTAVFILLVMLPMVVYLNPFTWGMIRMPRYKPSQKTAELIMQLNKRYHLDMDLSETVDTLWYFRDLKHHRISKLEHFRMEAMQQDSSPVDIDAVKAYASEFMTGFDHKKYFDSMLVSVNGDSVIFKYKLK
ncbi:hypothetical protein [Chryseobacterium sp. sg2396]|uniref:hypothetical protein n=1 Tax=Chryseobacterium sp. sg2396 TaxID=3276280 RepID=UPI003671C7E8